MPQGQRRESSIVTLDSLDAAGCLFSDTTGLRYARAEFCRTLRRREPSFFGTLARPSGTKACVFLGLGCSLSVPVVGIYTLIWIDYSDDSTTSL